MSDEYRHFLEQQEIVRRMMDPMGDLLKYIDPLGAANNQLGIVSTPMDFLRKEDERRKMLIDLTDVGGFVKDRQDYENQRILIEGLADEAQRLRSFDNHSAARRSVIKVLEAHQAYEGLFRLPEVSELGWIAHEAMEKASLARTVLGTEDRLKTAMATMRSPWLQVKQSVASAKAFSEIIAMGHGIDSFFGFDHDFAVALRSSLGDWRDMQTQTPKSLLDPVQRSGFYVDQGFDSTLTEFTPLAFDEGLRIARLRQSEIVESENSQEEGFARAKDAFDRLLRFEFALRRFIERVMQNAFGYDWMKRQLPQNMLDSWTEKSNKAKKAGCTEQPLIDYADFTDYKLIIERRDNWNNVFKPVFGRQEDVRESFQRLFPVRIATMHARIITLDDDLLLRVETKRVLKAIGVE